MKEVQDGINPNIVTISFDEKTGIQALQNISNDIMPKKVSSKNRRKKTIKRDPEYKRLGRVNLLAGVNMDTGEVYGQTFDRNRNEEFIKFLTELDKKIDPTKNIRLIMDNYKTHSSKETLRYLSTLRMGRFESIFVPKHGSWLNPVEGVFSKMARGFLRGMRVTSKEELCQRIAKGISELNMEKKPSNWNKFISQYYNK